MAGTKHTFTLATTGTDPLQLTPGQVTVALSGIRPRKEHSARPLIAAHVVTLAESIAALGLLEPPVISVEGNLLAGAHRIAALQLLTESDNDARRALFVKWLKGLDNPSVTELADRVAALDVSSFANRYSGDVIPALVIDINSETSPAFDVAVEAAENSVRRQYSPDEVKALAVRLKKAGYTDRDGRPKKGEKSVRVVLEALLGCSTRHVQRLLDENEVKSKTGREKAEAAFRRAAKKVLTACTGETTKAMALREAAESVLKLLPDKKDVGSHKP